MQQIDYSLGKCLNWGVSLRHLSLVSTTWKRGTCSKAIQHLLIGLVEVVPVVGQIVSLAERYLVRKLSKNNIDVLQNTKQFKKSQISTINRMTKEVLPTVKVGSMQPQVVKSAWGNIELLLNGQKQSYKDVVILPAKGQRARAMEWNWKAVNPGMSHRPGVRKEDIQYWMESVMQGETLPDAVILTRGRGHGGQLDNSGDGVLEIDNSTEPYLKAMGIQEIYMLKTEPALTKYKELCDQGKRVAAFIHTTC